MVVAVDSQGTVTSTCTRLRIPLGTNRRALEPMSCHSAGVVFAAFGGLNSATNLNGWWTKAPAAAGGVKLGPTARRSTLARGALVSLTPVWRIAGEAARQDAPTRKTGVGSCALDKMAS